MNWFINRKTGTKVLLAFGVMVVLLAVVIGTAYTSIRNMQATQAEIFEVRFANAVDLAIIRGNQREVRAKVLKILLAADSVQQSSERKAIDEISDESNTRLTELIQRNLQDATFSSELQRLKTVRDDFNRSRDVEVFPAIASGNIQQAIEVALGPQNKMIEEIDRITEDLVDGAETEAAAEIQESEQRAAASVAVFIVAAILAVSVAMGAVGVLNRTIARPLVGIASLAERVADSDLTVNVEGDGRLDEVGVLSSTFKRMIENLRKVTKEINEGVNVLASSSNEILSSTTEVASSASETASAISQTTTTVEEVKQTAQVSSQKSKGVSESAQRANDVAKSGNKAVEDVSEGMTRIHEQINSVAECITRLSEQSQNIGAIIATVDDIAEQSNLLAVNAAIEAAKAGEQGKGFAVVAQEVRNLAEQSKEATKQVRQILNEIQKGVTSAGMATEQGAKAVEGGLKQSEEAARAIQLLLNTIGESAQAALQIAASSQQQLVGMDQVAQAMESIRDASQQNVAAIRQVEESSRNLHELGQNLKILVEQYKT